MMSLSVNMDLKNLMMKNNILAKANIVFALFIPPSKDGGNSDGGNSDGGNFILEYKYKKKEQLALPFN